MRKREREKELERDNEKEDQGLESESRRAKKMQEIIEKGIERKARRITEQSQNLLVNI